MRILTIITMIYLPCTIVSVSCLIQLLVLRSELTDKNFYSTQFVDQKENDAGTTTLVYTQNAWLFFAISVPLTVFTIGIWYSWVNSDSLFQVFRKQNHALNGKRAGAQFFRSRKASLGLPR